MDYVYGWYHYQDGMDIEFRYPAEKESDLKEDGKKVTVEIDPRGWQKRRGVVVATNGNFVVIPTPASILGSAKSDRKAKSSRENGKLGGRPRKSAG